MVGCDCVYERSELVEMLSGVDRMSDGISDLCSRSWYRAFARN